MRPAINLDTTLDCGQVFHWTRCADGAWEGLIGEMPVVVRSTGRGLAIGRGERVLVERYFALDQDLDAICATFPDDPAMREAIDFCRGLRIIRQPAWECLATFVTSSMKQVAHIRQMSFALRERFGRRVRGHRWRAYPSPEALASASEEDLRTCGLGYRAKNLLATARRVADGGADLEAWGELEDGDLRDKLCELPGVGRKVANCTMLFGFGRLAAFPVDTWVERILKRHYWRGRKRVSPVQLEKRLAGRFGPYAGYAQQYLFHHARMTRPRRTTA